MDGMTKTKAVTGAISNRSGKVIAVIIVMLGAGYAATSLVGLSGQAQVLPAAGGLLTAVVGSWVLVEETKGRSSVNSTAAEEGVSTDEDSLDTPMSPVPVSASVQKDAYKPMLAVLIAVGLIVLFGFVAAFPVFILVYLRLFAKRSWRFAVVYAAVFTIVAVGLFQGVFGVQGFAGVFGIELPL